MNLVHWSNSLSQSKVTCYRNYSPLKQTKTMYALTLSLISLVANTVVILQYAKASVYYLSYSDTNGSPLNENKMNISVL